MKKLFKSLFAKKTCIAGFNISQPNNLTAADPDKDGITLFDLTLNNDAVLVGLDITEYTVAYFSSEKRAHTNKHAIETPWKYHNNMPKKETIFVRVTSVANPDEYMIASFTLTTAPDIIPQNIYEMVF